MFDFTKESFPEDRKRLFIFSKSVHSYETRSSQMFYNPKGKTSRFGLNIYLCFDGSKLWYKFFHAFLDKETDLTESRLKKIVKIHFLNTYVYFCYLQFYCRQITLFQTKYWQNINFIIIKYVVFPSITLHIVGASTSTTHSKSSLFCPLVFRTYFVITDTIIFYKSLYKFMYSLLLLLLLLSF